MLGLHEQVFKFDGINNWKRFPVNRQNGKCRQQHWKTCYLMLSGSFL